MKRVLSMLAATALVAGVQAQEAETSDEIETIGIGLRADIGTNGDIMPAIAVRWAPVPLGGEILVSQSGLSSDSGGADFSSSRLMLAGKVFQAFIERDNSSLYAGGKLGLTHNRSEVNGIKSTSTALLFGGLVGAEWRPKDLPELGFNFEVGYDISTESDTTTYGVLTSVGATYYF